MLLHQHAGQVCDLVGCDLAAQIAEGTRAYIDTNYNAHGCEVHDFETRDDMLKCIGHILKTGDNILTLLSNFIKPPL